MIAHTNNWHNYCIQKCFTETTQTQHKILPMTLSPPTKTWCSWDCWLTSSWSCVARRASALRAAVDDRGRHRVVSFSVLAITRMDSALCCPTRTRDVNRSSGTWGHSKNSRDKNLGIQKFADNTTACMKLLFNYCILNIIHTFTRKQQYSSS